MADSIITASSYQDPLFNDLRQHVAGCSDNFPVVMLPVRLETRFKNISRHITSIDPNEAIITKLLEDIWVMVHDLRLIRLLEAAQTASAIKDALDEINVKFTSVPDRLEKVSVIDTVDRRIIREAMNDLRAELSSQVFNKYNASQRVAVEIKGIINETEKVLKAVPQPEYPAEQPGQDAFNELCKLEDDLASVYGIETIPSAKLDSTLSRIDKAISRFSEIIESPGFLADHSTINAIKSKISYLKSSHKNSPVRLIDYKLTYSGTLDLNAKETDLRNSINDLKARIDEDYLPYMHLLAQLDQFPVRQLTYYIDRAATLLSAANEAGYVSVAKLLAEKDNLYTQLRRIREHAHRPLKGSFNSIHKLKEEYGKLEQEIHRFIAWSHNVTPYTKAHRTALSRLRTHLTREYLEDLKQLLPDERTVESQAFSNEKVRLTALSAYSTIEAIKGTRAAINQTTLAGELALIFANSQIEELKRRVLISTSKTILLPRQKFNEIKGLYTSLKDHIINFYNNKGIPSEHLFREEISKNMGLIEDAILDQETDVFDVRDRFYDEFRKRVTFLVMSETIKELWVRIYPDDIAIDNHDERLSEEELRVGKDYYNAIYSLPVSEREAARLPAWRAAASAIGARKAAYVIDAICPVEVLSNPTVSVTNPLSQIPQILSFFQNALGSSMKNWGPRQQLEYQNYVISLPATLEGVLNEQFFTPCNRTRPELETLANLLSGLMQEDESIGQPSISTPVNPQNIVQNALREAHGIIISYMKQNLQALYEPFNPGLSFRQVEMKSKDWDRAGITTVMPDRFVVVTKRDGFVKHVKVGRPVPSSLHVGIDPNDSEADEFYHMPNGDLHVPDKMRWMFDFDAAVEAGMAVRIPLQQKDFDEGFDFVMAFGLKTHNELQPNQRPQAGQVLLETLLKNHLYSDGGLEYLPVGTATNNTEHVKSPYKTLDNDYDGLFELFIEKAKTHTNLNYEDSTELKISDGQYFRDALGINNNIAGLIRHHEKQDISHSRAMNRALFGATLRYYMRFMMGNIFRAHDIFQTLYFMMRHVSAVGNIPSFRIDNQPYGVLPITLHKKLWLDQPTSAGTIGSYLHRLTMFLSATRKVYEESMLSKVNNVNNERYSADPQAIFLNILGQEPYSKEFIFREGSNVSSRWGNIQDYTNAAEINWKEGVASYPGLVAAHYDYLLHMLGHTSKGGKMLSVLKSRAYGARYVNSNDVIGALVQDPELGNGLLEKQFDNNQNYIEWLKNRSNNPVNLFNIVYNMPQLNNCNTLLFELLRISLMHDNGKFATNAVDIISKLDVESLERYMAGHLDLCSYRIDAWLTGLADYRLRELRTKNKHGIFVGAYGFVENLRHVEPRGRVQHFPEGLEPDDGSDVFEMPDNQGFIHGPSMNHAVTAAVLRAGYNSQKESQGNNIFGINLSSARIRKALHMLEGAAKGQEPGALLGYLFERALHENYKDNNGKHLEMDKYIFRLRRRFPTYSDNPSSTATAFDQQESIRALNVVDGVALLDHIEKFIMANPSQIPWSDDKTFAEMLISGSGTSITFKGYPWGLEQELPPITTNTGATDPALNKLKVRAIVHEFDNMADSFDAMGDLITSEGVYQLVRGNHTRAGAVLSAMSEGRVPADPEILKNLREGSMVTHRVLLAMTPETATSPWNNIPMSPRAYAEPALNHWLASQIGDPTKVDCKVAYGSTVDHLSIADLGMQPIDLVLLLSSGEEGMTELELRTADAARSEGATEQDVITIDFNSCSSNANACIGEYLSLLMQLGKAVMKARAADARDFRIAESEENFGLQAPGIDTEELNTRLSRAVSDYRNLLLSLSSFYPGQTVTPAVVATAKAKSKELTLWSFNGYYPDISNENDKTDLLARISAAKDTIASNLVKAEELLEQLELEPDHVTWLDTSQEITELLFGKGFKIIPNLILPEADNLRVTMELPGAGGILRNIAGDELETWLSDAAMVRRNLAHIETVRLLTEVLQNSKTGFSVAQLPATLNSDGVSEDYWLGAKYPESWEPQDDKLSLVILDYLKLAARASAIIFDEWIEIIPSETQTTGIALHYNQPDARPPQALLLAVTPKLTGAWSLDNLGLIVEEAYQMAKIRAVEPDHFDKTLLAQLLPATAILSGGSQDGIREMFGIPEQHKGVGMRGILSFIAALNFDEERTELG